MSWLSSTLQTVSSTSSATSTDSEHTDLTEHHEEDLHTTQKETITARRNTLTKAMSNAFSRTLTRMRSRGALNEANNSEGTLVIGVAVHETETEEAAHEDEPGLSEGAEATASTSDRTGEGEEGRFASIKRASISMRTAEVSVVAPASTKSESRSRSGSVNKLRSVLPLRSQNSTSESRPMPAPASGPPTPAMEESPKLEVTDAEGKIDDSAKKAKIGRRLSSLAKSFSQTLRRKKSDERTKERGTITNKGMFDAPLATATGSSSSVEKDLPSPTPVPPVPVPSDAVTEPLPPSPSSKPAALVKKVSSSLLAPDMVALPASPVASSFSSTRSPMRIDTDNRSDKASATASPASPNESFSNSIPILEKLDGVLEVAKEVMASNEDLQSTAPEGTATQRLVSDGSSYISKQNTISIIEERPSAEEPETTKEASGTGKSSEVGTAPSS